jgi:hypothetical protein
MVITAASQQVSPSGRLMAVQRGVAAAAPPVLARRRRHLLAAKIDLVAVLLGRQRMHACI